MEHRSLNFDSTLRRYRERRHLSQSQLGVRAGFDSSYVSRLENGTRFPTRNAVLKLADALELTSDERDSLLVSAGFMPEDPLSYLTRSIPEIAELVTLLDRLQGSEREGFLVKLRELTEVFSEHLEAA